MPDRAIQCVDCGNEFVFTEREQEWYREKGLTHEPRRCKACRSVKKGGGGPPNRSGRPPRGPASEGGPGHPESHAPEGAPDSPPATRSHRPPPRPKEMHKVACSSCGKETEVPFRPDTSRPVYCRDCFLARGKKR